MSARRVRPPSRAARVAFAAVVGLGTLLAAAASPLAEPMTSARAPLPGPATFGFSCADEALVVLDLGPYATALWSDRGVTLARVVAAADPPPAAGTPRRLDANARRFQADGMGLELHAVSRATWIARNGRRTICRADAALALRARVALRGSELVAFGVDEPWSLEVLADARERPLVRFESAAARADALPRTGWRAAAAPMLLRLSAGTSTIDVLREPCRDARFGRLPGQRVRVHVASRRLEGCGRRFDPNQTWQTPTAAPATSVAIANRWPSAVTYSVR
jgi:hypothetical protein